MEEYSVKWIVDVVYSGMLGVRVMEEKRMTIRYVRPLLPIELEKTRETPAIGMPVVLKSSGHVAVPLPTTPPHFSSLPVPLKQEWAERQNRDGADIVTRADVAEYVKIIGPAGSYAVFRALPGAR